MADAAGKPAVDPASASAPSGESKTAALDEAAKLPNPVLGAQQAPTAASGSGAQKRADAGDAAAKQKKVDDARKALADAEAALGDATGSPATTAEEDQKAIDARAKAGKQDIVVTGRPGGLFNIDGSGFGEKAGSLLIGDRVIETTRWNDRSIKGMLPADLPETGTVEVRTINGKLTGKWPSPRPAPAPAGRTTVKLADGTVVEGEIVNQR